MARYPSCVWKPITGTSTRRLTPDILCLHTCVGYLRSTWNYFNRDDVGVYSHICVGGIWGADVGYDLDGVAWQMADTAFWSAANLDGNDRVISVETADNAVRPIAKWTDRQCATIVRIMVDAHRIDGIPLVLIPDSKPGRRGIGFHRQGCDPYRVEGGERWSTAYGKDCPTQARIDQIPALIERARNIIDGGTDQEDDMFEETDRAKLDQLHRIITVNNTAGDVNALVDMVTKLSVEGAERDARILGRLDSLSLPQFTPEQVTELARLLDIDEDAVADAVRRDLAEALSGPAA